jgi:hypothetical protein
MHDSLCSFNTGGGGMLARCQCALIAKARADERVLFYSLWRGALEQYRRGLRAQVEALHPDWLGTPDDVLALLDGSGS